MAPILKPVNRPAGLGDQVYKTLREYLGSHVIRPGQPLQEVALAQRLGVSRTPVREALARLQSEGLIAVDGRSFVVPTLADADVDEIYQLRGILEPAALALVALGGVDAKALAGLNAVLGEAEAADRVDDADAFIEANARFHQAWQGLIANRRLLHAIALYAGHVRYLRVLTLRSVAARKAALPGMKNVVDALRMGDAERATRVMRKHLEVARQFLRQALDEIESEARVEGSAA